MEAPEAILAAAGQLFAERSPSQVSLREIARTAGVNYGLIHHYFGTKDAIIAELLRRSSRYGAERMSGSDTVGDALERLVDQQTASRHAQMLAWILLEERDMESLVSPSPAIARIASLLSQGEPGPDERLAAAVLAGTAIGWRIYSPFLRVAAGLDDADDLDDRFRSILRRLGEALDRG